MKRSYVGTAMGLPLGLPWVKSLEERSANSSMSEAYESCRCCDGRFASRQLRYPLKQRIASFEELSVWLQRVSLRNEQSGAVKSLEAMLQHRPVDFFEHIETDLDDVVRSHAEDVTVERRMVEFAERKTV
jgi:hypothetical protein